MIIRIIIIAMLIMIFASLASALVFLLRDRGGSTRTVKALSVRIGLSLALFLLLMAGFYFGIIPPGGIK
jgi:Protein of unknown function (DUF2909)